MGKTLKLCTTILFFFSQGPKGCWERKVWKDEGKCFLLTFMWTSKLEMKGGGKVPNNGVLLSFPCVFAG